MWILETTHPHKQVTIFGVYFVYIFMSRTKLDANFYELHSFNKMDELISVDKWISEVARTLDERLQFLKKSLITQQFSSQYLYL